MYDIIIHYKQHTLYNLNFPGTGLGVVDTMTVAVEGWEGVYVDHCVNKPPSGFQKI